MHWAELGSEFAKELGGRSFELSKSWPSWPLRTALERVRHSFQLSIFGYVVMPEHAHLLVSEPQRGTLAEAVKYH